MNAVDARMVPLNVRRGFSPGARYDLNLAVLTHCAERNMNRISCMKRWGVLNVGGRRVHITLIVNPGDFGHAEEIAAGWREVGEVSVLEMPCAEPIPKINGYYLWLLGADFTARWHGRVDDDSVTDVAAMLGYLDGEFGVEPVHVAGGPVSRHENEPLFVPFLLEHGIFIDDTRTEYESSFTSEMGMRVIFSHGRGRWLIEESGRRFSRPGDRALAFAAHVSGVRVVENAHSIYWFELVRLPVFGGDVYHMHYVPWHDGEVTRRLGECYPDFF
ncbi:hypothetical protein JIN84_05850 [Luteolibacter yonseiensis]|uniref:Uncharacterized protein n=1 Tax=Luteolibacter yonseiensis TaxID=1144680 RepID=A0A934R4I5_9BACT|nr:hypothetical protein [Luteolibacter yonseiensis]MBK1815125.1 hypothetical protein [Luteolibacter yonseiensis]